ncbi:MAG TPA: cytochrome c3 family protein [Dehalococcoidia bacterium]|nr:cytochrome c3 family protein [Dehalococcoidia bacterium]
MKKIRYILPLVVLLASLLFASLALADNGPHSQDKMSDPEHCTLCHRSHSSAGPGLLRESQNLAAFCYTCHGRDRSGAATNVQDGRYSNGEGLRGGGFEQAVMDPGLTGTPSSKKVTSAHSVDSSLVRAWGGGDISSTPDYGNLIALDCTSCHNPHGNGTYRMLRPRPKGMFNEENAEPVVVPDEDSPTYTITYDETTHYRDTSYVPENLDKWCAQCHTRYLAGPEAGHTPSGDAIFNFRHPTEGLPGGCLACHVAHGTTATVGEYGGAVNLPDGTSGGGASDSRLLHTDGRGVCLQCHSASSLTQN